MKTSRHLMGPGLSHDEEHSSPWSVLGGGKGHSSGFSCCCSVPQLNTEGHPVCAPTPVHVHVQVQSACTKQCQNLQLDEGGPLMKEGERIVCATVFNYPAV